MKASRIFYALLVAAIAASFGAGYSLRKIQTIEVDVPRTVTDTLRVEVERVVYKNLPAKHDTTWVPFEVVVHDTVIVKHRKEFASVDTVLASSGHTYGELQVLYYPFFDHFTVWFDPAPLPTIQVTKFIEKKRRWYQSPLVITMGGVIAGVALNNMAK